VLGAGCFTHGHVDRRTLEQTLRTLNTVSSEESGTSQGQGLDLIEAENFGDHPTSFFSRFSVADSTSKTQHRTACERATPGMSSAVIQLQVIQYEV
jgi:hypothetical protein